MTEPPAKVAKMSSSLDQLKQFTTIVADTGDFEGNFQLFFMILLDLAIWVLLLSSICCGKTGCFV